MDFDGGSKKKKERGRGREREREREMGNVKSGDCIYKSLPM